MEKPGGIDRAIAALEQEFFPLNALKRPIDSKRIVTSVSKWREEDGIIYFTVTSDGTTGAQWIDRLKDAGHIVEPRHAGTILLSKDFIPTTGVTTEIAVFKGRPWGSDTQKAVDFDAIAEKQKWTKPNAEVACLIREMFTNKNLEQMGIWWIVVRHKPIIALGDSWFLAADRGDGNHYGLTACRSFPSTRGDRTGGCAFVCSQVSITP